MCYNRTSCLGDLHHTMWCPPLDLERQACFLSLSAPHTIVNSCGGRYEGKSSQQKAKRTKNKTSNLLEITVFYPYPKRRWNENWARMSHRRLPKPTPAFLFCRACTFSGLGSPVFSSYFFSRACGTKLVRILIAKTFTKSHDLTTVYHSIKLCPLSVLLTSSSSRMVSRTSSVILSKKRTPCHWQILQSDRNKGSQVILTYSNTKLIHENK